MISPVSLLLAVGVAAQRSRIVLPSLRESYSLTRLAIGHDAGPLSDLHVTQNTVGLKRGEAQSLSSMYLDALQRQRTGHSRATSGTTPLISVQAGNVFLADVTFGNQDFRVVIDSGSSDPWLAVNGFSCYDPISGAQINDADCGFGPPYDCNISSTYREVADRNFNISYQDGEYLSGSMGYESVTMAGINVPNQQFGLVNDAAWYGDGTGSGLIGFAYSTLTSAYAGTDPTEDVQGNTVVYNPLFVNMYENQGVPPIFSLAISRDPDNGGILALGGIPDVPHSPYFASTPIQPLGLSDASGEVLYQFYSIEVGGYAYSRDRSTQYNVFSNPNPLKTTVAANNTEAIIDSGTSIIYVPEEVATGVANAFSPPATYDPSYEAYFVDCDALAPVFGVVIANKVFSVNPLDMIRQASETLCISAVQSDNGDLSILGDVFLQNVIAVFDIGAQQMRFAAREFYGLTSTPTPATGR